MSNLRPLQDLNLHFNKISKWSIYKLKFENHFVSPENWRNMMNIALCSLPLSLFFFWFILSSFSSFALNEIKRESFLNDRIMILFFYFKRKICNVVEHQHTQLLQVKNQEHPYGTVKKMLRETSNTLEEVLIFLHKNSFCKSIRKIDEQFL